MTRAAAALGYLLLALVLARAALAFVPSMWAWGLNPLRFLPPVPGWVLWALAAAALIPVLGRLLSPVTLALSDPAAPAWRAYPPWMITAAVAAWLFPDRLLFVGDFLLRETTGHAGTSLLGSLYPQGFPLDLFLHDTAMRALDRMVPLDANDLARLLGAIEAGLLGVLAVRFARVMGFAGPAAIAATAVVLCGGYLLLFTGYNKAFAELTVLVVAVGVFGIEAVTRGSGLLPMGVALGLALMVHRLALAMLPAAVAVWVMWLSTHGRAGAWRRPRAITAALIPMGALAAIVPHLPRVAGVVDAAHFFPAEARGLGGLLSAAFSGTRLADFANLLIFLSPVAPVLLIAAFLIGARRDGAGFPEPHQRRREALVLGALLAPLLLFIPFFHPSQGVFRDWDVFAPSGAALSLAVAWLIGSVLGAAPRLRWLAPAVALGVAAPTVHGLLLQSEMSVGLVWVEAYLSGPPPRGTREETATWDYLGMRYLDLGRRDDAADALARAAMLTPSPRILREWATAEIMRGRPERAARIYRHLLDRKPDDHQVWLEYAMLSMSLGDPGEARRAAERASILKPDDPRTHAVLEAVSASASPPSNP